MTGGYGFLLFIYIFPTSIARRYKIALKGKALAIIASLRSSGTAVELSRQLDDPQDEAIHLALLESPKIATTSSESNASRRSRAKANSKL